MVLDAGSNETFKAAWHAALGILVGGAALYNVAAFCKRRERHLAINAVVYTAGTVLEVYHTLHHVRSRSRYGESHDDLLSQV
jgi:hypothetical protein